MTADCTQNPRECLSNDPGVLSNGCDSDVAHNKHNMGRRRLEKARDLLLRHRRLPGTTARWILRPALLARSNTLGTASRGCRLNTGDSMALLKSHSHCTLDGHQLTTPICLLEIDLGCVMVLRSWKKREWPCQKHMQHRELPRSLRQSPRPKHVGRAIEEHRNKFQRISCATRACELSRR